MGDSGETRDTARARERAGAWAIFAALLIPALLLGPLFGGRVALLHSHGDEGDHVHVLPGAAGHSAHGVSRAWHAHAHGERSGHVDETPEPPLHGLVIAFPDTTMPVVARAPVIAAPCLVAFAPGFARALSAHVLLSRPPAAPRPPPPRPRRSSVEALLRSSHALLI